MKYSSRSFFFNLSHTEALFSQNLPVEILNRAEVCLSCKAQTSRHRAKAYSITGIDCCPNGNSVAVCSGIMHATQRQYRLQEHG